MLLEMTFVGRSCAGYEETAWDCSMKSRLTQDNQERCQVMAERGSVGEDLRREEPERELADLMSFDAHLSEQFH